MSPRPTLRATSTSRFGSSVYDARPSTSDGAMPASSSASEIAWHASDSSVSGSPLPSVVWPIPTTAVLSLIELAALTSPSTPVRGARGTTRRLRPSPRCGCSARRASPLPRAGRGATSSDASCSSFFAQPIALVGPLASRSAHSFAAACSSAAGTTLLTMPMRSRVGGREVVAEEDELLGLVHADDARQQVARRRRRGRGPRRTNTWMSLRGVGRDHEVGREHEHRAAARRGAVQRDDDRLLAV